MDDPLAGVEEPAGQAPHFGDAPMSSRDGTRTVPVNGERRVRTTIRSTDQPGPSSAAARSANSRSYTCWPIGCPTASVARARCSVTAGAAGGRPMLRPL